MIGWIIHKVFESYMVMGTFIRACESMWTFVKLTIHTFNISVADQYVAIRCLFIYFILSKHLSRIYRTGDFLFYIPSVTCSHFTFGSISKNVMEMFMRQSIPI